MLLEVKDASFAYGSRTILQNVNLSVAPHDVLAVLGRNGAGKTTLLKCIMNMLPWKSGCALLEGQDIRSLPHKTLWRQISYVPQARQGSDISVRDMVVLGRSPHLKAFSNPGGEDYRIADDVLKKLDLEDLAEKKCSRLSGGELQLVLIGRALASQPKLLILDEPESHLDYNNQLRIMRLIRDLSHETACILNTHHPEHALRYANRSLLLKADGACVSGESDTVITEESLRQTFGVDVFVGKQPLGRETIPYIIARG